MNEDPKPVPEEVPAEKGDEKEKTVAEILGEEPAEDAPKAKVVPEAVFLEEKKGRKDAEKKAKALEAELIRLQSAGNDATDEEMEALSTEFNVDPRLLTKLAQKVKKEIGTDIESKLEPITRKSQEEELNKRFTGHFQRTLEDLPHFKDIADPDVIKALSLQPENRNKTFAQLIEKAYGHVIPGKRTIDAPGPGGTKEPEEVDMARMRNDTEYYSQVMKDPEKKRQYNESMMRNMRRAL